MIGKHEAIILQKDFEHGRRYRHPFRSRVDFVESCCRNEGKHILNSRTEEFLVQCSDARQIGISPQPVSDFMLNRDLLHNFD